MALLAVAPPWTVGFWSPGHRRAGSAYLAVKKVGVVGVAVVAVAAEVVEEEVVVAVEAVDQMVQLVQLELQELVLHWQIELPLVPVVHCEPEAQVGVRCPRPGDAVSPATSCTRPRQPAAGHRLTSEAPRSALAASSAGTSAVEGSAGATARRYAWSHASN